MKKLMVFGVSLIALLFMINLVCAVRINEVMANPKDNCNDCTEWIELHTDSQVNMINWTLDTTGQKTNFSFYIEDFLIITGNKTSFLINWNVNESKIIEWKGIGLVNGGDNVSLYNGSELISSIKYPSLPENKTYSLLSNSSWIICDKPTPGSANSCESQTPDNNNQPDNETKVYLDAEWDEENVVNGKEFEVEIKAYNLKDRSYNLKVWIEFKDNDTVISERYDEENDEWKSGTYYVDNFFSGIGNKSKNMKLRIKEDYRKFLGTALLKAKIESGDFVLEKNIKVLEEEKPEEKKDENKTDAKVTTALSVNQTKSIIKLGRNKIQEQANETSEEAGQENKQDKVKVIYESSSEKVKKYAIYALNMVLIVIIVFLLKSKKRDL